MKQRGTFQLMKSVNKSIVLNKIRMDGPISRAQIAKETSITPPTVSSIVKELIQEDVVVEKALGVSQGGRKPTLLHINQDAFYVIGVDAGPSTNHCILTNLAGDILCRTESVIDSNITNKQFLNLLKKDIQSVLEQSSQKDKVIGIGVAMHGVVSVDTGVSLVAPNLRLHNIPIKAELEKEFGYIVKVENDARAMALGEAWFGDHGEVRSLLAVNIGNGVGGGIVIDGNLYHGAQNIAGEIGHMTVDMNGPVCQCGNRGCLQSFATGWAIAQKANKESGEEVYESALAGEKASIHVFKEVSTIIGIGLTNLIHVINPERIVIGGGVTKAWEFLLDPLRKTIRERALTREAKETEVVITNLGDDATLLGAVSLLLVELFSSQIPKS